MVGVDPGSVPRTISEAMLLGFFIHEHPDAVEVVESLVYEARRQKPMSKAYGYVNKPATISVAVPDDVVKNMNGDEDRRDWYVLVRVSRSVIDKLEEEPSRIITPDTIVTP